MPHSSLFSAEQSSGSHAVVHLVTQPPLTVQLTTQLSSFSMQPLVRSHVAVLSPRHERDHACSAVADCSVAALSVEVSAAQPARSGRAAKEVRKNGATSFVKLNKTHLFLG